MARTFKDKDGHEWSLDMTHWHTIQFEEIGVNIDGVFEAESWITRIASDRKLFAKMLMIVLEDQLKKHNVSEQDFYKRLNQQAVEGAVMALFESAVFFSKGEAIANAVTESVKKLGAAKIDIATEQIGQFTNLALDGLSKSVGDSAAL